jgi:drug/metabolite transporter (DMT)-like permease
MLLLAAMIWGLGFTAQDAIEGLDPFTIGSVRSWIAGFFLILVIMLLDRVRRTGRRLFSRRGVDITRTELVGGVLCGIALATASVLQQVGITDGTDGGKAAFITSLYVVIVPIYALVLRKRAPLNVWIGVAIAAVGFYFLCIKDNFSIAGSDIPVIMCALVFPVHILIIDHFSPSTDGARLSMIQFFTCAAIQTVPAIIIGGDAPTEIIANILPLVYLGIGSSGIAYTLQILGQGGVEPAAASIIMSLESVFGVLGALIILNSTLSEREYIGCAIVLAAVILSQLEPKKKKNDPPNVTDA